MPTVRTMVFQSNAPSPIYDLTEADFFTDDVYSPRTWSVQERCNQRVRDYLKKSRMADHTMPQEKAFQYKVTRLCDGGGPVGNLVTKLMLELMGEEVERSCSCKWDSKWHRARRAGREAKDGQNSTATLENKVWAVIRCVPLLGFYLEQVLDDHRQRFGPASRANALSA